VITTDLSVLLWVALNSALDYFANGPTGY